MGILSTVLSFIPGFSGAAKPGANSPDPKSQKPNEALTEEEKAKLSEEQAQAEATLKLLAKAPNGDEQVTKAENPEKPGAKNSKEANLQLAS